MIFIFSCKLKVLPVSSRWEASHSLSSFHYPSLLHLLLRVSDGYKYRQILSSPLSSRRRPGRLRSRERGADPEQPVSRRGWLRSDGLVTRQSYGEEGGLSSHDASFPIPAGTAQFCFLLTSPSQVFVFVNSSFRSSTV